MELIYATTNKHKLAGAKQALAGTDINLIALDKTLPDVPEIQSDDQAAVSVDKALKYYELLKHPLVVMDSGLFIDELNGFPGVYTKYALDTIGIDRIVQLLGGAARAGYAVCGKFCLSSHNISCVVLYDNRLGVIDSA